MPPQKLCCEQQSPHFDPTQVMITPMLLRPHAPSPLTLVGVPVGVAWTVVEPAGASMQYAVPGTSCEQLLTEGFACRNCDTVIPPALDRDAQVSPLLAVIVRPHPALGATDGLLSQNAGRAEHQGEAEQRPRER